MLFYKSDFVEIYYYSATKMLETRWLDFAPSEGYRECLEQYLDVCRQHDIRLWLGDYRLARVIRMDDQEWTAKEWFPRFLPLSASIEKMARVQAEDVFSQMSSDSMKEKLDISGLPFLFSEFKHYEDAKNWLLQQGTGTRTAKTELFG